MHVKPLLIIFVNVFLGIACYSQNTFNKELFPYQFFGGDTFLQNFDEPRMYQDSATGNLYINYTGTIWDGYQQKQGIGIAKLDSLGNFLRVKHIVHPNDTQLYGYSHIPLLRNDSIFFMDYTVEGRIAYLNIVDTNLNNLIRIKTFSDLTKWGWRRPISGRITLNSDENHSYNVLQK